jgi:predicted dehydrogenase
MIRSVKVLGAGSIGNHMSHAARALGWSVDLCDISGAALERSRSQIYPGRYGSWDDTIGLYTTDQAPRGEHDLIIVGTPPDTHMDLALEALSDRPKALLIEKPLCGPSLERAQELFEAARDSRVRVFVGYDHVVGMAAEKVAATAASGTLGAIETLDVEFREHWGGIFAAHPWLDGPGDSYLGHWRRGGGASGEHSHAINLWQSYAHAVGAGSVIEVSAILDYVSDDIVDYDKLCLLTLKTERGLIGRVVQDVVTNPPRKWARIQGRAGYVEWHCGFEPGLDAVIEGNEKGESGRYLVEKSRPDDFIRELKHIAAAEEDGNSSPIDLVCGLNTMMVVAAAHESAHQARSITINYEAEYTADALQPIRLQKKG